VLLFFWNAWAQVPNFTFPSSLEQRLEKDLQQDFVGVVHVVQDRTVLFSFSKGKTLSGGVLGEDSFLPLSSLSSHIVSLALVEQLSLAGESIDDPVQTFFPRLSDTALSKDGVFCTVRSLLNHRCGLPSFIPGQQEGEEAFFSSLNRFRLREKPGAQHRYSFAGDDLAMMLLSRFLRENGQETFSLLQKEYIKDCGVMGTLNSSEEKKQMQSVFYTPLGFASTQSWFHISPLSYLSLPNHTISSAKGLSCWLSLLMEHPRFLDILPKGKDDYGLGIAMDKKSYGRVVWHSSKIPLQANGFWGVVPETKTMVVILSPQSNAPYSVTRLGHMILDEIHGKENIQDFSDKRMGGKIQSSLPAVFPIFAAVAPLIISFILFLRAPIPRMPFAFRLQFCFFASLFVRQSTPFSIIPLYEWGGMLSLLAILLYRGLKNRLEEPLFYPHRSFGMMMEYLIYGIMMVMWIQRVPNVIPLLCSFGVMAVLVGAVRK
jgi:hypothetical protein